MLHSNWQESLGLYIGDTKQFQPMALAKGQKSFSPVFSSQRQISLFRHVEDAGRLTAVLKRNHRARYNAAEWALETFYGRDMSIVYRQPTEATETFRAWLQTTFQARCSTAMLRPREISETPVGTSYANFGNAHLVIQPIIAIIVKMPISMRPMYRTR